MNGKRIFWTENASRGVGFHDRELQFLKVSNVGGAWRGYLATDHPGVVEALTRFCATNRACREVTGEEFENLAGFSIPDAAYPDQLPKVAETAVAPAYPSFTEQTEWENGLFTFPTESDLAVHFNCSIAEHCGSRWLFTRRHRFFSTGGNASDLGIFRIRPNMTLELFGYPELPKRYAHEQWEDPRVVVGRDNAIYISLATWVHHKPWFIRQSFCRLNSTWKKLEVVHEPEFGGNSPVPTTATGHEKNWVWFEHGRDWHFVYKIIPHVVAELPKPGNPFTPHETKNEILALWKHGEPRGGTPPVRVGDEYVSFFHSSQPWQSRKRRYFMGAYTFSAKPPFAIQSITPEPLLAGSERDFRELGGPLVVFPNGALLDAAAKEWTVVFGVNDENCAWMRIPDGDLRKRLNRPSGTRKGGARV